MRARLGLVITLLLVVSACGDDAPVFSTTPSTSPPSTTEPTTAPTAAPTAPTSSTVTASSSSTSSTTTTTLPPPPLSEFEIDVELVSDAFAQPVLATVRPGDDRLFVIEQGGMVIALDLETTERTVILDINDLVRWNNEQGLLGLAFYRDDPNLFVVHYTANDGSTVIAEYEIDPESGLARRDSARQILKRSQPAANHNGGMIQFGPDGYLYIGLGDGGGAGDTFNTGQDPFNILGTILRIDLGGGRPYAIPADNPFANGENGAPEVWAWGLRNPWRFAFDGFDLWVGDVGQGAWEEIDLFDAGRPGDNAGWPLLEGNHCYRSPGCDPAPFLGPVVEYAHSGGRCSVTGGAVYRGSGVPELIGTYLYGDYCTGEIWGLRLGEEVENRLFTDPDDVHLPRLGGLTSFGVGPDGEMYVMQASGRLWRVVSSG
jgi:glucose/arabinose dehydrogenase